NRIVLRLGVRWREAALLRALARYRQLSGLDPSQAVQEAALAAHPDIAALMLALFRVRFDPALPEDMQARRDWAQGVRDKIEAALAHVVSLDEDRVLRRMTDLIGAIVRTNYYQPDTAGEAKPYISFKIASRELADLPAPKPFREIWVSSPQVEGVHLRFGPVARGGLRWSDRRDDFRTEVLDLVKAQQVKNAIIVPVGAKGGFFPKRLPARAAPGYLPAGVEAYRTYLRGLLDLTDNIVSGATAAPAHVVRWDGDDPYLVVAADKGTATFSDIANAMAAEYGFWLGDAFASGGSVGYDHKAMGITARGAWEAVKRHFREIGKNIQEEPFDVIGVGDMSGDVFGNGMLLSRKIRLLAAFDHRHIFIDPAPRDLDAAWAERKRLFDLQRSSWDDYDKNLISEGGGVFARTLKAIPITAEIAELTGFRTQSATPAELIGALLRSPCELLWFGGIGAFIKARAESNADVGDRANDFTRVDAEDVRALVIGEGANLGVTQRGRIAFARKGGRINSDAIDNSAGVDTSDHEVNIKILLADAIESGALGEEARPELLASMTEEVAALVLRDNYDQTLALTLAEANAPADLDSHERFMERLEKAEKLSRTVEGLPSAEEVRALRAAGLGLTRPELAKIIAYSKLDLSEVLAQSSAPDDPAFEAPLVAYFPPQLKRFEAQMKRHRLRRELIATYLADDLVNFGGATFVDRVRDATRADAVTIACAYEAGRRIFALNDLITRIHALDNESPASAQTMLYLEIAAATRRIVMYLAPRMRAGGVGAMIEAYEEAVTAQRAQGAALLTAVETARFEERRRHFIEAGAPADLARETALIAPQSAGLHAADLARKHDMPVLAAAFLHRAVGAAFGLDRLRAEAVALKVEAHWDRLAIRRAVDALFAGQDALADAAAAAIAHPGVDAESAADAVSAWRAGLGAKIAPALETIAQLDVDGGWSFAKLMLASAEVSGLVSTIGR
ncbi:MAG: NAD-glutamate dehydrogenase domain-containing protein, partial [Hyphomonadaceae bacterium]